MKVVETKLSGVLIMELPAFRDARGYFMEVWNQGRYRSLSTPDVFEQDNLSFSERGVLRGLHFQSPDAQGKLITVIAGEVFDAVVDLRCDSPTFGQWVGAELSAANRRQLYAPEGFAHGFVVTSDTALVSYKCTRTYAPDQERILRWDDPDVGIEWPVADPILSEKDTSAPRLRDIPKAKLFRR